MLSKSLDKSLQNKSKTSSSKEESKVSLNLKDFSPTIQISTETMMDRLIPEDTKDFLWTSDIRKELPIFLSESGNGSIKPMTMMELFDGIVNQMGKEEALFVE